MCSWINDFHLLSFLSEHFLDSNWSSFSFNFVKFIVFLKLFLLSFIVSCSIVTSIFLKPLLLGVYLENFKLEDFNLGKNLCFFTPEFELLV